MLRLVELNGAGGRRVKGYSLGMRQRLSLAGALLGDPRALVLDEPANGLDPQGIRWLRDFLRAQAADGRTVLVSSHVLAEMAQTVDEVVVISRGRLVAQGSLDELTHGVEAPVWVRSPEPERLRAALAAQGERPGRARRGRAGWLAVRGASLEEVGTTAAENGIPVLRALPAARSRSSTSSSSSRRARRRAGDRLDRRRAAEDPHHAHVLGHPAGAVGLVLLIVVLDAGARRQPRTETDVRTLLSTAGFSGLLTLVLGGGGGRRRVPARHDRVDAAGDAEPAARRQCAGCWPAALAGSRSGYGLRASPRPIAIPWLSAKDAALPSAGELLEAARGVAAYAGLAARSAPGSARCFATRWPRS